MASRHTVIALLVGLTLVVQGLAYAQSSATVPAAQAVGEQMPCHDMDPSNHPCCSPDSSCPDMLICLTGHAVVPAMVLAVPLSQADFVAPRIVSRHASNQPPTVFRPPIVIHG